jgi:hypothetical protein
VSVTAASPTVDTKKTTTGGVHRGRHHEGPDRARPVGHPQPRARHLGEQRERRRLAPASGPLSAGTSNGVQWNLEGSNITDMSSGSPSCSNFGSFREVQVITGSGDVSVQSAGLFINLVTRRQQRSRARRPRRREPRDAGPERDQEMFDTNTTTTVGSGYQAPPEPRRQLQFEVGGPVIKNRLWFWGGADYQDINAASSTSSNRPSTRPFTYDQLSRSGVPGLRQDHDPGLQQEVELHAELRQQVPVPVANELQGAEQPRREQHGRAGSHKEPFGADEEVHQPDHQVTRWTPSDKLMFTNQCVVAGGFPR